MLKPVATTVVAAVLVLASGACGKSENSSQSGQPAASSAPTSAASPSGPPFPKAEAKTAASAALLAVSDLPAGWSTSKDDSDDSGTEKFQSQLSDCLDAPAGLITSKDTPDSAHADTPDFDSPDGDTSISETVTVTTTKRVDQLFTTLRQENATDCLTTAVNGLIKHMLATSDDDDLKNAKIGDAEVGQLNAGTYGDDTLALRVTVPFEVSGFSTSVYMDELYIRHGNATAELSFESTVTPIDPDTTAKFARTAAKKLTHGTYPSA